MLTKDEITAKLRSGEFTADQAVEALQALKGAVVRQPPHFRVGEKGGLSIYFEGARFPVNLFVEQADELFAEANVVRARQFVQDNHSKFKTREQKREAKEAKKK